MITAVDVEPTFWGCSIVERRSRSHRILKEARHWYQPICRRLHTNRSACHDNEYPRFGVVRLGVSPLHERNLTHD